MESNDPNEQPEERQSVMDLVPALVTHPVYLEQVLDEIDRNDDYRLESDEIAAYVRDHADHWELQDGLTVGDALREAGPHLQHASTVEADFTRAMEAADTPEKRQRVIAHYEPILQTIGVVQAANEQVIGMLQLGVAVNQAPQAEADYVQELQAEYGTLSAEDQQLVRAAFAEIARYDPQHIAVPEVQQLLPDARQPAKGPGLPD